jgi:hypothetical protein
MGVSFNVSPYREVSDRQASEELDTTLPLTGRYPSLQEIRNVVSALQGYEVSEYVRDTSWQISLHQIEFSSIVDEKGYATLECLEYEDDPDAPHDFYFYRAHPETIIILLRGLAKICGPFMVIADYGDCVIMTLETEPNAEWVDCTGSSAEDRETDTSSE